ncbi:hypothetical protein RB601_007470 [Gaeumannomyces tritici]
MATSRPSPSAWSFLAAASLLARAAAAATAAALPAWQLLQTGSTAQLRGLSALPGGRVAFASGSRATVLRTIDAGATWQSVGPAALPPADAASLEFRDVEAFSADRAVVLSVGEGGSSRVYATTDAGGGNSNNAWRLAFTNDEPRAFFNCLAFASASRGFAVSDPVDGRLRLVETSDGGESWTLVDHTAGGMPETWPGEAGFAASGTCLTASADGRALFAATGGVAGRPGRVFRNGGDDDGARRRWEAFNTTIPGAAGGGVFSVQFRSADGAGVAVGGDYTRPGAADGTASFSTDGGRVWQASVVFPGGYRSAVSWVPGRCGVAVAVGPTGSDVTYDGGRTWKTFDNGSFDAVQCVPGGVCWASGQQGRAARLLLS